MTENLLPCPFCGGNDIQIEEMESFWDKNETSWRVLCIDCIAETAGDTKEQAIAAWNGRADHLPVVRGEWIDPNRRYSLFVICGACKGTHFQKSKYCPSCGAKMEEHNETK